VGAVLTLGPVESISGSPGSAENAASPPQPDLLVGKGVRSMEQPHLARDGLNLDPRQLKTGVG
jgi:hypothetical protein